MFLSGSLRLWALSSQRAHDIKMTWYFKSKNELFLICDIVTAEIVKFLNSLTIKKQTTKFSSANF